MKTGLRVKKGAPERVCYKAILSGSVCSVRPGNGNDHSVQDDDVDCDYDDDVFLYPQVNGSITKPPTCKAWS